TPAGDPSDAEAFDLRARDNATVQVGILNNNFDKTNAGNDVLVRSFTGSIQCLDFMNNGPVPSLIQLENAGGIFNVEDLVNVDANNPGAVTTVGVLNNVANGS